MAQYPQHHITEWQFANTSNTSRSNYQGHSSSTPRLPAGPTLSHPSAQDSTNTSPQPRRGKDCCTK